MITTVDPLKRVFGDAPPGTPIEVVGAGIVSASYIKGPQGKRKVLIVVSQPQASPAV